MISEFFIYWSLICDTRYCLSWRMFHVHLRRKYVCSCAFGWKVHKTSIRSIWSSVSFQVCVCLLNFCFDDLSIGVSGIKSPLLLFYCCQFSPLCLLVFALCIEVLLCGCINIYNCYLFLDRLLDHYVVPFFISYSILYIEVYIVWSENCHSSFLLIPFA